MKITITLDSETSKASITPSLTKEQVISMLDRIPALSNTYEEGEFGMPYPLINIVRDFANEN